MEGIVFVFMDVLDVGSRRFWGLGWGVFYVIFEAVIVSEFIRLVDVNCGMVMYLWVKMCCEGYLGSWLLIKVKV